MNTFFVHLIPGGLIVQQDYAVRSRLIWIHATMEYFWNKLEDMGSTAKGGSTIFRVIEPITKDEALACVETLQEDCLGLARKAADRYDKSERRHAAILASIDIFNKSPLPLSMRAIVSGYRRRRSPEEVKKLRRRRRRLSIDSSPAIEGE